MSGIARVALLIKTELVCVVIAFVLAASSDNLVHVLDMLLLMLSYLSDGISLDDSCDESDDSDFESAADKSKLSIETPLSGSGKFRSMAVFDSSIGDNVSSMIMKIYTLKSV